MPEEMLKVLRIEVKFGRLQTIDHLICTLEELY